MADNFSGGRITFADNARYEDVKTMMAWFKIDSFGYARRIIETDMNQYQSEVIIMRS